jgi:hypothetical protein
MTRGKIKNVIAPEHMLIPVANSCIAPQHQINVCLRFTKQCNILHVQAMKYVRVYISIIT